MDSGQKYKNNRLNKRLFELGGVVKRIRTVFEKMDKYVYIPDLR